MTIRPGFPCMLLSAPSRGRKACTQHSDLTLVVDGESDTSNRQPEPVDAKTDSLQALTRQLPQLVCLSAFEANPAHNCTHQRTRSFWAGCRQLAGYAIACVTCNVPTILTSIFFRKCSMGWYINGPCTARPALLISPKRVWPSRAFLTCTAD